MLTLGDLPTLDTGSTAAPTETKPAPIEAIKIKALTTWNALTIGVVTGFALSFGTFLFETARDKIRARR